MILKSRRFPNVAREIFGRRIEAGVPVGCPIPVIDVLFVIVKELIFKPLKQAIDTRDDRNARPTAIAIDGTNLIGKATARSHCNSPLQRDRPRPCGRGLSLGALARLQADELGEQGVEALPFAGVQVDASDLLHQALKALELLKTEQKRVLLHQLGGVQERTRRRGLLLAADQVGLRHALRLHHLVHELADLAGQDHVLHAELLDLDAGLAEARAHERTQLRVEHDLADSTSSKVRAATASRIANCTRRYSQPSTSTTAPTARSGSTMRRSAVRVTRRAMRSLVSISCAVISTACGRRSTRFTSTLRPTVQKA